MPGAAGPLPVSLFRPLLPADLHGIGGALRPPFDRWMEPLFGVGGAGAAALVLGLVGGYPAGARAVAQLVERGECSREEAGRLSRFCNNCGPAFFLGAVGVGVFGSQQAGLLLLGANLLAALLVGFLSARGRPRGAARPAAAPSPALSSLVTEFPGCVQSAFSATLGVCAYVILFSVLTALAEASGLLPALAGAAAHLFPGEGAATLCRGACIGFLEISTGTAALREAATAPAALPLAAFLLGWGGLSVYCQSLPFWRAAGVRPGLISGRNASRGSWRRGSPPWPPPCCRCRYRPWRPCRPPAAPGPVPWAAVALLALAGGCWWSLRQKRAGKAGERASIITPDPDTRGGRPMLFQKKIDPSCAYCRRGKQIGEDTVLCQKKGVVSPEGSCSRFRYDPLKRVPPRPVSPDFSRLKEDFQL